MSSLKKSSAASKSSSSRGGAQRAELTEEQKQEIKEAFDLFDTGHNTAPRHTAEGRGGAQLQQQAQTSKRARHRNRRPTVECCPALLFC